MATVILCFSDVLSSERRDANSAAQEFNKIVSDLLALELNLEEEDKALILIMLSSLPPSYDHLVTTILYGNETLELEDVRVMLINNDLMKKTDSTDEALGLVVKKDHGRSRSKGPKRDKKSSNLGSCYYCKKPGHFKRDCFKREEVLKKLEKKSEGASTRGKSEQVGVVEEDLCEFLTAQSGQGQFSDIWLRGHIPHVFKEGMVQHIPAM